MSRTKESQSLHDKIISEKAAYYESQGYLVNADHIPEYKNNRPDIIGNHIPDIIATKKYPWSTVTVVVIEVETIDSYSSEHTKKQLIDFSKKYKTIVFVPGSVFIEMFIKISEWKLNNVEIRFYKETDQTT